MWTWLQNIINMLKRAFKSFIDVAIPAVSQVILAELKDAAIQIVEELEGQDLSSKQKRADAFSRIKKIAESEGKDISDSLINVLIELALQFIRNKTA